MKSEEQTDLYELAIDIFYEGGIKKTMNKIEQYAELRIQQEREKWKEEVIKAYHCGQDYEAYKRMKLEPYPNGLEYYESVVKPRIESK